MAEIENNENLNLIYFECTCLGSLITNKVVFSGHTKISTCYLQIQVLSKFKKCLHRQPSLLGFCKLMRIILNIPITH